MAAAALLLAALTLHAPAGPPATSGADAVAFTPEEREVIELLGIAEPVEELREARAEAQRSGVTELRARDLLLRSPIATRVFEALLDIDRALEALDTERHEVQEARAWVQTVEERHTHILDIAVGVLAGGAAVGTGLTLFDRTTRAGTIVGTAAGVVGTVVALMATRPPRNPMPPLTISSGMLGPFLGRPGPSPYPPLVWRYLSRAPPGATRTRRDSLVLDWRRLGRVHGDPNGGIRPDESVRLTGSITAKSDADLGALSDRALMLADVRATVSAFKGALTDVVGAIQEHVGARP